MFGTWPEQVEALRERGLRVTNPDGSKAHVEVEVTSDLAAVAPADFALVLVKSYQTRRTARQAAQVLKQNGLALTLQNGMGNLEILGRRVGTDRAALGVTMQAATVIRPGHVAHTGAGHTYLARRSTLGEKLTDVAQIFNEAGVPSGVVNNLDGLLWGKLAINAAINPLTALLEIENGQLLSDMRYRELMLAAVQEAAAAASVQTILLPFSDPVKRALDVCQATAHNRSSMLQDLMRSAPTEIDAICGAIVRVGRWFGVRTYVNEFLLREVKRKEAGHLFTESHIEHLMQDESFLEHRRHSKKSLV